MIIEEHILDLSLIGILILNLIVFWFQNYTGKKASNRADKEDTREISYEGEKGKNIATKEDIAEITKQVEDIKNYVSFSAQKRFNHLNEQERILVEILHMATLISQSQNKLIFYLHDVTTRQRYDLLVDFINDSLTQFYHLSNLAIITIQDDKVNEKIENLSMAVTYLGLQVCAKATNAANLVSTFNSKMDYALNKSSDEREKNSWLSLANIDKQNIEKMKNEPIEGKVELNKAIEDYKLWLKQLYGKEFFIYKQVEIK